MLPEIGKRLAGDPHRCEAPLLRPRGRGADLTADGEPHRGCLGAGALPQDLGHARQHVLGGVALGDPIREVGQHLVRRGAPAVHDPIREAAGALADRLERHREHRSRHEAERRVEPGSDERTETADDPDVDHADRGRHDGGHDRFADHQVEVPEPVAEHGDPARGGDPDTDADQRADEAATTNHAARAPVLPR